MGTPFARVAAGANGFFIEWREPTQVKHPHLQTFALQ